MRRTEILLRATGVLDEAAISTDEFGDEEDDLETDSQDDDDEFEVNTERHDVEAVPGYGTSKSRKPPSTNAAAKSSRKHASDSERPDKSSGSSPGDSAMQNVPVFRCDQRGEARYYGMSRCLLTEYY